MARLIVHVEGQTEETFVNEVLAPHLYSHGYQNVSARIIGNARQRSRRGGIKPWSATKQDILNHLRKDGGIISTTMIDYYGLPHDGPAAWPGRNEATVLPFEQRATTVETRLLAEIQLELNIAPDRFIPFVIMHEFEGLLFSDCDRFAGAIGRTDLVPAFQLIRDQFNSPEEINDSNLTSPSHRIEALMPGYQKPIMGSLGAIGIGLDRISDACPHFREWLNRLEMLTATRG